MTATLAQPKALTFLEFLEKEQKSDALALNFSKNA